MHSIDDFIKFTLKFEFDNKFVAFFLIAMPHAELKQEIEIVFCEFSFHRSFAPSLLTCQPHVCWTLMNKRQIDVFACVENPNWMWWWI